MNRPWRNILLVLIAAGATLALSYVPPLLQDQAYHAFADQRVVLGIPRFLDIATNLPFLIVGIAGLLYAHRSGLTGAQRSWTVFFTGVALVGIGSACYHLAPTDAMLVWDRLPMTVGFTAVVVAVLSERLGGRIESDALAPAVFAGLISVLWWVVLGDLRPYIVIQLLPLVVVPAVVLLHPGGRRDDGLIHLAIACYLLAKAAERYDAEVYAATRNNLSGHSLKHLLAAAGCATMLVMVKGRQPVLSGKETPRMRSVTMDHLTASGKGIRQGPA